MRAVNKSCIEPPEEHNWLAFAYHLRGQIDFPVRPR
jgi:hypothetical protein